MLLITLPFNDFYFLLTPITFLISIWFFFFKVNTTTTKSVDGSIQLSVLKINPNNTFSGFYFFFIILSIILIYTLHGKNSVVFYNHFSINNFTIFIQYVFCFASFLIFFLLNVVFKKLNLAKSIDYLFAVSNLVLLLPYLFFINTVFSFLFFLELVSVALLYKLISSKIWFKTDSFKKNTQNNIPQNFINMVFFQYWVTFFSTIFIIYFYVNVYYIYGTSDWYIIQYLNYTNLETSKSFSLFQKLSVVVFLFSVFFKLGITPFHLFKVEVYKGIPFISIFLYTTYYFSILFSFFLYFMSDFIGGFSPFYYTLLILFLFIGCIYTIILLFDVSILKAFFTYSTVINTIGFLIVYLSSY